MSTSTPSLITSDREVDGLQEEHRLQSAKRKGLHRCLDLHQIIIYKFRTCTTPARLPTTTKQQWIRKAIASRKMAKRNSASKHGQPSSSSPKQHLRTLPFFLNRGRHPKRDAIPRERNASRR